MRSSTGTIALLLTLCCLTATAAEGQRRRAPAAPAAGATAIPVGYPGSADQVRPAALARGGGAQFLTNQAKLSLAQSALATGRIRVSGVGTGLRLTANQPYVADRAYLKIYYSTRVETGPEGGDLVSSDSPATPTVLAHFRASVPNQPLLIDFHVNVSKYEQSDPLAMDLTGPGGINHTLELPPGDHHVTAIVVPSTLGWYAVVLRWIAPKNVRVSIDYVEITPLH